MKFSNKGIDQGFVFFSTAVCLVYFFLITGCGDSDHHSESSEGAGSDTGSISYTLRLADAPPASFSGARALLNGDACADYGIELITADVFDAANAAVSSDSWPCPDHPGIIEEVPPGSSYSLIVEGTVASGNIDWRGEKSGITVTAGENTDVGFIVLFYVGDDDTPPQVITTDPADAEICVPTNSIITAKFSEDMVSATLNESTFTIANGAVPVTGIVNYDPTSRTAAFTPDNVFSFATGYTVTISEKVEDIAGNNMANDVSWHFTTAYAGDYDTDCDVDGEDLSVFSIAYADGSLEADLTRDGVVTTQDVMEFSMNYGQTAD
jgi:hypothetical protein